MKDVLSVITCQQTANKSSVNLPYWSLSSDVVSFIIMRKSTEFYI